MCHSLRNVRKKGSGNRVVPWDRQGHRYPARRGRVEGSRRIIRIARESGRRIAAYAKSGKPISARVVRQIILRVARRWFPSLPMPGGGTGMGNSFSQSSGGSSNTGGQNRGTWVRQGNRIILQGA